MRCLQSLLLCKMVSKFSNSKERVDDGVFYTRPHFVGNSILLYGRKNSYFPFHCMIGPHWPLMIFTLLFITLPTYWFLTHIAGKWDSFLLVSCSGSLLLSSFIFTACSDPGIVFISPHQSDIESQSPGAITYAKLNNIKNSKGIPCGKCNIDRPSNAFHCYDCNACMEDLDHHCVWTGKCIARKNLWGFYAFLFSMFAHMAVLMFVTISGRKELAAGMAQLLMEFFKRFAVHKP